MSSTRIRSVTGAPTATTGDGLLCTEAAAERIGLSAVQLRRIVRARGIAPDGTYVNPHHRSGPRGQLWSSESVDRIGATPDAMQARARRHRRRTKDWEQTMRARFGYPEAAIPAAASALFNLNRYTRYPTCSAAHRQAIQHLKAEFVSMLYALEQHTDRVVELQRPRDGKRCFSCNGDGDVEGEACPKCDGTGWFVSPRLDILYAFTFTISGLRYSWIVPEGSLGMVPDVEETRTESSFIRLEMSMDLRPDQLAEAKAIVRFALGHMRRIQHDP